MKMKEFGPRGARPWRPPLDPPMQSELSDLLEKDGIC